MPPELNRYTPRDVQISGAGRFLTALMGLLFIAAVVAGLWAWFAGERGRDRLARIERDGIGVDATIVAAGRDPRQDGAPYIVYEYVVDGRTYSRQVPAGPRALRQLQVGEHLRVRYLAGIPERTWPVGFEPRPAMVWVFGFVPAIVLGLVCWGLPRTIAGQRHLLTWGRGAPGRIIGASKVSDDHGNTKFRVEIEFQTLSGATRRIKVTTSGKAPVPGNVVTLLYDSDNPSAASLYPLSLVRVRDR